MRWLVVSSLLLVLLAPLAAHAADPPGPITFKTLLIIKRSTDVQVDGKRVRSEMTKQDIDAVKRVYLEHIPKLVDRLTEGRVKWDADVVTSKYPLKSLSYITSHRTFWPAESNVQDDIAGYVALGKYDSFCIYYKTVDADGRQQIPVKNDWGLTPAAHTNHAGMSSVH